VQATRWLADKLLVGINNHQYDFRLNGELRVLEIVAATGPALIFDVGSNVGRWSAEALRLAPAASIHTFDPVDECAAQCARLSDRVVANAVGLGARTERVAFRNPEGGTSELASRYALEGEAAQVPMVRGDEYARDHGITSIDFIKVDAEGGDFEVLSGFGQMHGAATPVVQFEFMPLSWAAGHPLSDYHRLLEPLGFSVGKIFPDGCEFGPYDPVAERWAGLNHIAVHESQPALRTALG
jgi:FkbM family methyltransferase